MHIEHLENPYVCEHALERFRQRVSCLIHESAIIKLIRESCSKENYIGWFNNKKLYQGGYLGKDFFVVVGELNNVYTILTRKEIKGLKKTSYNKNRKVFDKLKI